jgi:hypothetical protein
MSKKTEKRGLDLEKITFYAHVFLAISAFWEILKVLWEGWHSIWATILGLNWVLGIMISMTFLFWFSATIWVSLLPASIAAGIVYAVASRWVFSMLGGTSSWEISERASEISGLLAIITFWGVAYTWGKIMLSPLGKEIVPIITWVLALLGGALVVFRGERDFAPFWITVIRVVGWLAMLVLLLISTGVIRVLKEKLRPSGEAES